MYFTLCDTPGKLVLAQLSFGCLIKFPFDSGETPSFLQSTAFLCRGGWRGRKSALKPSQIFWSTFRGPLENVLLNPTCGEMFDKRFFLSECNSLTWQSQYGKVRPALRCAVRGPHARVPQPPNRCKHSLLLSKIGPVSSTCPSALQLLLRLAPTRTTWIRSTESPRQPFYTSRSKLADQRHGVVEWQPARLPAYHYVSDVDLEICLCPSFGKCCQQ